MREVIGERERERESITRSYRREKEGVGTIGLDWLGRGWRAIGLVVGR